jgi:hypothetical protein
MPAGTPATAWASRWHYRREAFMQRYALPMAQEAYARVPDLLRAKGIEVEPQRDINEFKMLRCRRGDVAVLLSMTKPAHWANAGDVRQQLVVIATLGESLFRFWRIPRENRLRREIIELLRPHSSAGADGSA